MANRVWKGVYPQVFGCFRQLLLNKVFDASTPYMRKGCDRGETGKTQFPNFRISHCFSQQKKIISRLAYMCLGVKPNWEFPPNVYAFFNDASPFCNTYPVAEQIESISSGLYLLGMKSTSSFSGTGKHNIVYYIIQCIT